jgi:hypothetical protein
VRPSRPAANGREGVRDRQRRDRANAPTVRQRHPEVSALQVDFDFSDSSEFLPSPQVTVFHPAARAYFRFPCPYGDCSGEFDLTAAVVLAVDSSASANSGQMSCGGMRFGGATCTLCLEYEIAVQRT